MIKKKIAGVKCIFKLQMKDWKVGNAGRDEPRD